MGQTGAKCKEWHGKDRIRQIYGFYIFSHIQVSLNSILKLMKNNLKISHKHVSNHILKNYKSYIWDKNINYKP